MPSDTVSKRAKRLVSQLAEFQVCDLELPGPTCLSIKHYLRSSKHCRTVEIPAGPGTEATIRTDRRTIRKFILSQLEAQRLTSQEPSVSVVLSPLVRFILSCIPAQPSPETTTATLFQWHSFANRRTFCIFAFVYDSVTMPSHTYTAQELLCLRDLGMPMSLANAPQKGEHQASQSGPTGRQVASESRTLGRFHKFRPYHVQQTGTIRTKADHPEATDPPGDVLFARQQPHRDPRSGIGAEMEWRYRGRAGSEATSSAEPLSAPTGLNAQQSEGFQRFYKAVVSPSHVRVTAGGRIVPNTRGTSPMSKRNKDAADEGDHVKEGIQQVDDHAQPLPEGSFFAMPKAPPAMPFFAFPPHPFYPPFPTPLPGMPLMPMPMGIGLPGGFPFHQPALANNASAPVPPDFAKSLAKENQQSQNGNQRNASGAAVPGNDRTEDNPQRAASNPFEHAKPFFINGQLVYPYATTTLPPHMAPGSHPPFPPGLVGHPAFPMAAFHNPVMGAPLAGMNQMLNQPMSFAAAPGSLQVPQANHNQTGQPVPANSTATSAPLAPQPPTAPPISSIRPSDISRKQIEMLRSSLKYHEDQVQYNRHQIDEKEMEHTIQMLQSQIDRFEALNQSQLRFEESHYPKRNREPSQANGQQSHGIERAYQATNTAQGTTKHASTSTRRSDSVRHKPHLRKKEPFFSLNPVEPPILLTDPVKKSTLPSGAALAPPFEPQSIPSSRKAAATRSDGAFQWDGAAVDDCGVSNESTGKTAVSSGRQGNGHPLASSGQNSGPERPYLVGALPPGVNPRNARDGDYVYERELTQDETRSRYLFWGKAPSFTRRGLPKFDGKDFYPPSPAKDAVDDSPPPLLSRRIPIGDPNVDYYTEADQPRSMPPSRPPDSRQHMPSFVRERQKPVKVTLRRPDSDVSFRLQKKAPKIPEVAEEQGSGSDRHDKHEPQADHSRTKFLHTVLNGTVASSSKALPSTVTSATAQGVYSTNNNRRPIATTLGPMLDCSPVALGHPSPVRFDEGHSMFLAPAARKVAENCPLPDSVGPASLEQQFQSIVSLKGKRNATAPLPWGAF